MATERDLIQRMARELDLYRQLLRDDCTSTHPFADEARALLSQPEPEGPSDRIISIAMAVQECASAWEPTARLIGNVCAEDIADLCGAVLARWGRPATPTETP